MISRIDAGKTIEKINLLTTFLALAVIFSACGGGSEPVEDNTIDEVIKIETEIETAPESVTVFIERGSRIFNELEYCNFSQSNVDEWGPKVHYIHGEPISFEVETGCYYDFRCVDNADNEYYIWDVLIEEDEFTWLVELSDKDNSFADNHSVSGYSKGAAVIVIHINPVCGVIRHIYCERLYPDDPMSDVDRLGMDLLYPDETFTFHVPVCYSYKYFVRLESTSGEQFWFYDIDIDENGIYLDVTLDNSTRLR